MKIVDVAVPHFDDENATASMALPTTATSGSALERRKSTTPFTPARNEEEYTIEHEDEGSVHEDGKDKEDEDVFYEAPDLKDGVSFSRVH